MKTSSEPELNVFLLDNDDEFVPGLKATLLEKGCRLVRPASAADLLKQLDESDMSSDWDMLLIHQSFLQNGRANSCSSEHALVEALRERHAEAPVAILSDDDIDKADHSYMGLRKEPHGREGYTTYIFKHSEQDCDLPTNPDDVFTIINVYKIVSEHLERKGWLEKLMCQGELPVGISVVDCTYRLQYVNNYQRQISCRQHIQRGGICWMEYNPDFCLAHHCPWCPCARARIDLIPTVSTTISPVWCDHWTQAKGDVDPSRKHVAPNLATQSYRFYDVRAFPIIDPASNLPIACLELVFDKTKDMLDSCRASILMGQAAFREAMEKMLGRICALGFDRARLWLQNLDSRYLDGFALYGRHNRNITEVRLDERTDPYLRKARTEEATIIYFDRTGEPPAKEIEGLRSPETPCVEVRLWTTVNGSRVFVGKINLDNEPSNRELLENKHFWPLLEKYAEMLGPIIWDAREFFMREERSRQTQELRELDSRIVQGNNVTEQLKAITQCVKSLVQPDHCHIRLLQGNLLALMAADDATICGRNRDNLEIPHDENTSISVHYAVDPPEDDPLVFSKKSLLKMASNLRSVKNDDTADYVEKLESSAAFGLKNVNHELIGVLVLDSTRPHFFDSERIATTKELVSRAQSQLANSLMRTSLESLVNALDSEVVVFDRQGRISLSNQAWKSRTNKVKTSLPLLVANLLRCSLRSASFFEAEAFGVFKSKETAKMVGEFDNGSDIPSKMAVMVSPFEKNALGQVVKVLAVLTDITDIVSVEEIVRMDAEQGDLPLSLVEPLRYVRNMFKANRASAVELLPSLEMDYTFRVLCRVDDSGGAQLSSQAEYSRITFGEIVRWLNGIGFLAIPDVEAEHGPLNDEMRNHLKAQEIRSLLAAPILLSGEPWGTLVLSYKEKRLFSGKDIYILRAAAAQLSAFILLSQQAELRKVNDEFAAQIGSPQSGREQPKPQSGLLCAILSHAVRIAGCKGGHLRMLNLFTDKLELREAINDPLVQTGKSIVRESVPLGQPVAGIVALTGEAKVVNRRTGFDFNTLGIPQDRADVLAALEDEQSFACLPLIYADEVLGTVTLTSEAPSFFIGRRLQMVEDLMGSASLAFYASRQMERMKEMSEQMDELLKADTLSLLWPEIPMLAVRLFGCEYGSVSSYDYSTNELTREAVYANGPDNMAEKVGEKTTASAAAGCGLSRYVAKAGGILSLAGDQARMHPNLSTASVDCDKKLPSRRFKSYLIARLDTPDGKPVGVLRLINRKGRIRELGFTKYDEALMKLLVSKIAIAIDRLMLIEARNRTIIVAVHDLKTPLHNIRVTLNSLMQTKTSLPEHEREQIRVSNNACKQLDAFVLSTYDAARGKPDCTKPSEIDAEDLVNEALEVFWLEFQQDQWQVDVEVKPEAKTIYGDRTQLLRVLLNLCYNTWTHGRAKDTAAKAGAQKNRIEIKVHCRGEERIIQVADQGPGLPFQRAAEQENGQKPTRDDDKGSGVGLISTRLIAEAHEGKLEFGNRTDGKSGFQVSMIWNQAELRKKYQSQSTVQGVKQ